MPAAVHIASVVSAFTMHAAATNAPAVKSTSSADTGTVNTTGKASTTTATSADDSSHDISQEFAQLLDDEGAQTEDNSNTPTNTGVVADASLSVSTSALAAQELAVITQTTPALLTKQITPQDAKTLLASIDTALSQNDQSAGDQAALKQLQTQLQHIENSGTPQSVSDIVAAIAAAQPATTASTQPTTPVSQRVLSWLQKTLSKNSSQQEASAQDATGVATASTVSATVQSLQAGMFRPADADADAPQTQPKKKSTGADTTTQIVPLAASLIVAQAAPVTPVTTTAASTASSAAVSAIATTSSTATTVRPDLKTAIPALTDTDDADAEAGADDETLPEIDLPGLNAGAPKSVSAAKAATTNAATAADSATPSTNTNSISAVSVPSADANAKAAATANFAQHLQATATTSPQAASEAAKSVEADVADEVNGVSNAPAAHSNSATNPVLNPSLTGGSSPANSAAAVQPVAAASSSTIVNAAPIVEQVHVAIKQASQEGVEKITIQLDPVDLGRVEVKMHTGADGQTQVSFTVDKPSTFDALSRDAHSLQRSLQDAGIKADAGNMQFNLRQQPQSQLQSNMSGQGQFSQNQQTQTDDEDDAVAPIATASVAALTRNYTVNVREGIDIQA